MLLHVPVPVPADVAESIGRELLVYGRRIPKAEMFARIDAVDADTVRAVADRCVRSGRLFSRVLLCS